MTKSICSAILVAFFLFPALASAAPPEPLSSPSVSGTKEIYQLLQADPGQWSNMEAGSYFYEWQRRVDGKWQSALDFDANYIPGNLDVGRRLRVSVIAINAEGQAEAFSPAYYIRGSGVNGVGIYPHRRGSTKLRGRVADWGRVVCNEGYCKIRKVRAKINIYGRTYRLRVRYPRGEIKPDTIAKIRVVFPRSLAPSAIGQVAKMRVRASSTNGDVSARTMRTRIVS